MAVHNLGSMSCISIEACTATAYCMTFPDANAFVCIPMYQGLTEGLVRPERGVDTQGGQNQNPPHCLRQVLDVW